MEIKNAMLDSSNIELIDGIINVRLFISLNNKLDEKVLEFSWDDKRIFHPECSFKNKCSAAGYFISRCLIIADVNNWDDLYSNLIRVKIEKNKIVAIGHILKEEWLCPETDFKK